MNTKSAFSVWAAAILLLTTLAISETSAIAQICPQVGVNNVLLNNSAVGPTYCGTIITIDDIQGAVVTHTTGQGPYDGADDTLVGVRNNSSKPLRSMVLRSALPIFHFDGDGICSGGFVIVPPGPNGCPFKTGPESTGYEGPNVSFTNRKSDFTEGTVRFDQEILSGQTAYFALEAAISTAFACPAIINDTVIPTLIFSGTTITATFLPKNGLPTRGPNSAATACGVTRFNWVQKIIMLPNPSPFYAINPADPNHEDADIQITSAETPFNDPHQNGTRGAWNSYPFYFDPKTTSNPYSLDQWDKGTKLNFWDSPADSCLFDGNNIDPKTGKGNVKGCIDPTGKAINALAGKHLEFTTRLVGILADGSHVDLGIGFNWQSNYNGKSGGTSRLSNLGVVDPGSGTGGITITHVQNVTDYQYNGIVVTVLNDVPIKGETIPPAIMVSATPKRLWPPNHTMVPVTVSGTIKDIGGTGVNLSTAAYVVRDEYGLVQPAGTVTLDLLNGSYSFTIQLQASRKGDDEDGRQYHITVSAEDNAGNKGSSSTLVIVPHDQRNDRKHHRKHHREDDREHDRKDDRGHDQRDDQDHDERDDRRH
jgi:hypothetical protein